MNDHPHHTCYSTIRTDQPTKEKKKKGTGQGLSHGDRRHIIQPQQPKLPVVRAYSISWHDTGEREEGKPVHHVVSTYDGPDRYLTLVRLVAASGPVPVSTPTQYNTIQCKNKCIRLRRHRERMMSTWTYQEIVLRRRGQLHRCKIHMTMMQRGCRR